MTIPSGSVGSWTTAQIQAILPSEIPQVNLQIQKFSSSQFAALAGPQLASLLTSQGPGVVAGSWGDIPKYFNTTSLAQGIAAQPQGFLARISVSQWQKIVSLQPTLLSIMLPLVTRIADLNSVNWYSVTGNKYKYLAYLSVQQISDTLVTQGPSILYGDWYDAPVNISTPTLAAAIALQQPSYLKGISSSNWQKLFNLKKDLLTSLLPLLPVDSLAAVDWNAAAAGSGYIKNSEAIAWGSGASFSTMSQLNLLTVHGVNAVVNKTGGNLDIANGMKWLYVTGSNCNVACDGGYQSPVVGCVVIDNAQNEFFSGFTKSQFTVAKAGFRSTNLQYNKITFKAGTSGTFDWNGIVGALGGNTVTVENGCNISDLTTNETYNFGYNNSKALQYGNIVFSNMSLTPVNGGFLVDTKVSKGDVINSYSINNTMSLVEATVNGSRNTVNIISSVSVNGDSNTINVAAGDGFANVNGVNNIVNMGALTLSGTPAVKRGTQTSLKITDTSTSANIILLNSNASYLTLNGAYAAINANSSLAANNKLSIDVTNLASGVIYQYANENLTIVGNTDKHIQLLIQAMASSFSGGAQAMISTQGGSSNISPSQFLTVTSH